MWLKNFLLGFYIPICAMWAFEIRTNMPALPASPHKRMKRVESSYHSSPQLVTMGATRGRKGELLKYTCILHPPLSTAHINTHRSDLMCCTFPLPGEHAGTIRELIINRQLHIYTSRLHNTQQAQACLTLLQHIDMRNSRKHSCSSHPP